MSASNTDLLLAFLEPHLGPEYGSEIDVAVLYENYSDWWADHGGDSKPLAARAFWVALRAICSKVGIAIEARHGRPHCLNVRLIDPSLKGLPAPNLRERIDSPT